MPKKPFDLKWLIALLGGVGVLSGAVVGAARYITLPQRVEAVEKDTNDIKQLLMKQDIYNEAVQDILKKDKEQEIILSPDGRLYWDKKLEKWRPIRELE